VSRVGDPRDDLSVETKNRSNCEDSCFYSEKQVVVFMLRLSGQGCVQYACGQPRIRAGCVRRSVQL